MPHEYSDKNVELNLLVEIPLISPSARKLQAQFLADAENNVGILPDICSALVKEGLVEWVEKSSGLPVDLNDPRALLRLSQLGHDQLARTTTVLLTKQLIFFKYA